MGDARATRDSADQAVLERLLASRPDLAATVDTMVELFVPARGDAALMHVFRDGRPVRTTVRAVDPATVDALTALATEYPPERRRRRSMRMALETGEPYVVEVTDEAIAEHSIDERHAALLHASRIRSQVTVPLRSGDRSFGILRVGSYGPGTFSGGSPAYVAVTKIASFIGLNLANAVDHAVAQEHAAQLRAMLDSLPMALVELDRQGRVVEWSKGCERLFGWTREEILGTALPAVPDEVRHEFEKRFAGVLSGDQAGFETTRQRKDGTLVSVLVSAIPLRDPRGGVIGTMAMYDDLSELRRLESARDRLALEGLSERERQVVELLRAGLTYSRIATEIGAAESTVRTLVRRAYRKLDIHSKAEIPAGG